MAQTTKIRLQLHNHLGDMTVSPTLKVLSVKDGDSVQWEVDAAGPIKIEHFSLIFADGTPFRDLEFDDKRPASGPVRPDAVLRSYHSSVTVTAGNRIFQIPGCPEIIIR